MSEVKRIGDMEIGERGYAYFFYLDEPSPLLPVRKEPLGAMNLPIIRTELGVFVDPVGE